MMTKCRNDSDAQTRAVHKSGSIWLQSQIVELLWIDIKSINCLCEVTGKSRKIIVLALETHLIVFA